MPADFRFFRKILDGGFNYAAQVTTAATTGTIVANRANPYPKDEPMKHRIRVRRIVVEVITGSAGKTWTFDSATTHTAITAALDMSTAGVKYDLDFGERGIAVDIDEDLRLNISAAGAAAVVTVEGWFERTTTVTGGVNMVFLSAMPQSGPQAGGTLIEIQGWKFLPGPTVTVGGVACTSIKVYEGGKRIQCITGAHAAGAVNVVVTNTDATTVTGAGAFTYV